MNYRTSPAISNKGTVTIIVKAFILLLMSVCLSFNAFAENREKAICGLIKEPFMFWVWSRVASVPDKSRVTGIKFVESVEFKTSDNKILRGYRYQSNDGKNNSVKPRGYVLMAPGNAMISDQIIGHLREFAEKNLDVYVFDYRGYGNSDGKRRLNAIIEDYKEIAASLNKKYDRKLLYGISLGGAVMLNVIGSGIEYDSAVIDSSPSLLSDHGCPERVDPVKNLPEDAGRLLVITGKKDRVLNEGMTSLLRKEAKKRGANTVNGENFAHPFMDGAEAHSKRMQLVIDHLVGD